MLMLPAFMDESSDGKHERVFAMACLAAPEDVWQKAETEWVERTGRKEFHAANCESEHAKHPDPNKHKANLQLYADLTQILAQSLIVGRGVALDIASHRELFPGVPDDVGYYKCFSHVVVEMANLVRDMNTVATSDDELLMLQFYLDHRIESEFNVSTLYSSFVKSPEWREESRCFAGSLRFETRSNPRMQMADLFARETMKALDNRTGPNPRGDRKSLLALAGADGRFRFTLYARDYMISWRKEAARFEADVAERSGMTVEGYRQWLISEAQLDNWSNRFRYLSWFDANQHLRR